MKVRILGCVLFYVVFCNLPLWLASRWLGIEVQGLFCLEFLAVGALSLLAGWRWLSWLLGLFVIIDIFCCIERTYMMNSWDMMQSAPSLPFYAKSHVYSLVAIAGATLAVSIIAVALGNGGDPDQQKRSGWALVAIAGFCLLVDAGRGKVQMLYPGEAGKDSIPYSDAIQSQSGRLMRNFVHRMVIDEVGIHSLEELENKYTGNDRIKGASAQLVGTSFSGGPLSVDAGRPNLVFVLLESWGKPLDRSLDNALVAPYQDENLQRNYTVSMGTVPFRGPTVAGELRELCGTTMAFGVIAAPAARLANCLPRKLTGIGYHTMAVHGFLAPMFGRERWYPKIGFEETHFLRDFQREKTEECPGPFPGACDADVTKWIGDRLQVAPETPQFIYWVTLNSHLPVPIPNLVRNPPVCLGIAALSDNAICSWYQLIFNVHRSISELAAKEMVRSTIFVVVGDHAPPFSSQNRRGQFSNTVVPYVILWPKGALGKELQPPHSIATVHPLYRSHKPPLKKSKVSPHPAISGD